MKDSKFNSKKERSETRGGRATNVTGFRKESLTLEQKKEDDWTTQAELEAVRTRKSEHKMRLQENSVNITKFSRNSSQSSNMMNLS